MAVASARANIALVKYWGKRASGLNLPAAGSLSLTLAALETRTSIRWLDAPEDRLELDGQQASAQAQARASAFVDLVRQRAGRSEKVSIVSANAFPTGAGLASSASAFAALAKAASDIFEVSLSPRELSVLARQGSGSAARSVFGDWVRMHAGSRDDGLDAYAEPLLEVVLDLVAVIAVVGTGAKKVGSTEGMERTRITSPYHQGWISQVDKDLETCTQALRTGDMEQLADVVEGSCLAMHANAMAARPGIIYFTGPTLWAIDQVRTLRAGGTPVCFTVDAGPHLVAFTPPEHAVSVAAVLGQHPDIDRVITTEAGPGVRSESEEGLWA